jgi:hypothetical protein
MKKVVIGVLLVGLAGCVELPSLHVGMGMSGVLPTDSENLDGTYQLDGVVRVDVMGLQVEGTLGWRNYEYSDSDWDAGDELAIKPFALVVKYGIGPGAAKFLFGGGLVWNITDESEISGAVNDLNSASNYRLEVGAHIALVPKFDLTVELLLDFTDETLQETLVDLVGGGTDTVDTSGVLLRVASTYNF